MSKKTKKSDFEKLINNFNHVDDEFDMILLDHGITRKELEDLIDNFHKKLYKEKKSAQKTKKPVRVRKARK